MVSAPASAIRHANLKCVAKLQASGRRREDISRLGVDVLGGRVFALRWVVSGCRLWSVRIVLISVRDGR